MGKPGVAGPAGAAGKDGKDGKDGKPGLNGVPGLDGQVVSSDELLEFFASSWLGWSRRLPVCPRRDDRTCPRVCSLAKRARMAKTDLTASPVFMVTLAGTPFCSLKS